jgi:uncharacterized protein (TIGR00251 family)
MSWYYYQSNKLLLMLHVQPGNQQNEMIGLRENRLKIKLASPAIEGQANKNAIKFLAKLFKVPQAQVRIRSGLKSRFKCFEIENTKINPQELIREPNH